MISEANQGCLVSLLICKVTAYNQPFLSSTVLHFSWANVVSLFFLQGEPD